jgi:hypothetical protein
MIDRATDRRAARFEEAGVLWWTVKRTYRPGDWAHYVLAVPGVAIGLIVLWAAVSNGTLSDSRATPVVIIGLLGYGWFTLTKKFNRRTVTLDAERLRIWDGPLLSFANRASVPIEEIGRIDTSVVRRLTMPPTQIVKTYRVEARGVRGPIVKKLQTAEEADAVRAGLVNTLERLRRSSGPSELD